MISSRDIEANGLTWTMIDKFVPSRTPVILNTDLAANPGNHWIVAFIHRGIGYVADPLGKDNIRGTSDGRASDPILRKAFSRVGIDEVHLYPYSMQLASSTLCGWFSIYIATMLKKYIHRYPTATVAELDRVIQSRFGKTADRGDERTLEKAFTPGGSR
jgi:hypothetical protein